MPKKYFVYILMNVKNTVLYIGIASDLGGRVYDHKIKFHGRRFFTGRYNVDKLVYYEYFVDPWTAIAREKQLKHWRRQKKLDLIIGFNPSMCDLYEDL